MAAIRDKVQAGIRTSLKSGDGFTAGVLRMLLAALERFQIERRSRGQEVTEEDEMRVLAAEAKKRKEAAEIYAVAGRAELKNKEENELKIIEEFLPASVTEAEIAAEVEKLIKGGQKEFGPLMKSVMSRFPGRADGKLVGKVVKEKLAD